MSQETQPFKIFENNEKLEPGTQIGDRFVIMAHIGSGGMGNVYKAKDMELDEIVALKILKSQLAEDDDMITRFKREIKIARRIQHPNICSIYDFFTFSDKVLISMEYIEGEELYEIVVDGRLDSSLNIIIMLDIAKGLAAAHETGIMHRDLKPANIMIDKNYRPIVMDFGVARFEGSSDLTRHEEILGTPLYMAPEQFKEGQLDKRIDIYALGILYYFLYTAELPFSGRNPLEIALQHLEKEPIRPRMLNSDIPDTIENLIMKCLEKNPDDRYQHVVDIIRELENHVNGLGTTKNGNNLSSKLILVADDDKNIRDLLSSLLERHGFNVIIAENGEQAVALTLEYQPSLICLDIVMPTMDGYHAAEFLKNHQETKHIPIMLITSKVDREYKAYSKNIGIEDYLIKPFDVDDLLDKIHRIIYS